MKIGRLLSKDEKSDLMQRVLNYLYSFWKQLFAYRNNGEYTIIEICKQVGVSFRDYFRAVLKEMGSGREGYENLLPMPIGLKQNINVKF